VNTKTRNEKSKFRLFTPDLAEVQPDGQVRAGGIVIGSRARRISFRLNGKLRRCLEERSQQTHQTVSEVIREALEFALQPKPASEMPTQAVATASRSSSPCALPPEVQELLPANRGLGAQMLKERRIRFRNLVALCEATRESTQTGQDAALCAQLVDIGKHFGLL
jgi:hypothetical protein